MRASGWIWQPVFSYAHLNRLYEKEADPFNFESNPYEAEKYAHTLRLVSGRTYKAALEIGAAEGVFTEMLAPLCESVVALEVATAAVQRATARLADLGNVAVVQAAIPTDWPPGRWDLIVASDVLYYLPRPVVEQVVQDCSDRLAPGGRLLGLHYAGDFGQMTSAEEVHEILRSSQGLKIVHEERVSDVGRGGAGYQVTIMEKPLSGAAAAEL